MTWELSVLADDGVIAMIMCGQHALKGPMTAREGEHCVYVTVQDPDPVVLADWLQERAALVGAARLDSRTQTLGEGRNDVRPGLDS